MNDFAEFEQFLILDEKLLHKVPVEHLFWWHVELQLIRHIRNEVILGLEACKELLRHDSPLLGTHKWLLLLLLSLH